MTSEEQRKAMAVKLHQQAMDQLEDLEQADRALAEAIRIYPSEARFWFDRGRLHEQHHKLEQAVRYYTHATARDGTNEQYRSVLQCARERMQQRGAQQVMAEGVPLRAGDTQPAQLDLPQPMEAPETAPVAAPVAPPLAPESAPAHVVAAELPLTLGQQPDSTPRTNRGGTEVFGTPPMLTLPEPIPGRPSAAPPAAAPQLTDPATEILWDSSVVLDDDGNPVPVRGPAPEVDDGPTVEMSTVMLSDSPEADPEQTMAMETEELTIGVVLDDAGEAVPAATAKLSAAAASYLQRVEAGQAAEVLATLSTGVIAPGLKPGEAGYLTVMAHLALAQRALEQTPVPGGWLGEQLTALRRRFEAG